MSIRIVKPQKRIDQCSLPRGRAFEIKPVGGAFLQANGEPIAVVLVVNGAGYASPGSLRPVVLISLAKLSITMPL